MPILIIFSPMLIILIIFLITSSISSSMNYIWDKSLVDNKFAIGDKVIIKRGIYRGKEGIIKAKAYNYKVYDVAIEGSSYRNEIHEDHMEFYDLNKILSS